MAVISQTMLNLLKSNQSQKRKVGKINENANMAVDGRLSIAYVIYFFLLYIALLRIFR